MDNATSELIHSWRGKVKNLRDKDFKDDFVYFFIYYMCLDAWITDESGEDSDEKKIKWLVDNGGILKEVFVNNKFDKQDLIGLRSLSPIKDMRPKNPGKPKHIRNEDETENFEKVVRFIYQIRCNLFHGGKSPTNRNDQDLVYLAGQFLKKWIDCAHMQLNSNGEINEKL